MIRDLFVKNAIDRWHRFECCGCSTLSKDARESDSEKDVSILALC